MKNRIIIIFQIFFDQAARKEPPSILWVRIPTAVILHPMNHTGHIPHYLDCNLE
jgi:hypothetical protein